ncbi:MAG: acyl-CoA dehydrogenase family protein [Candidatus Cloacimonetes bacterium]|nr:acyl-CoA dehydrogenase family protein [Candidatus Cloacimonadota bacterium]
MILELNEDQKMIRDSARDFAEKFVAPVARQLDVTQEFPVDLIKQAGEMGFMGVAIPEQYGGSDMDYVSYVLMMEEISRHCASTGVILSVNNSLVCDPLLKYGTEEQKQKYLKPLAMGEKIGCYGLTEANSGSDCASMKTVAKKDGEGWIVNGSKIFITNGTNADTFIVFTSTDASLGNRGITAFIIERDMPGVSVIPMHGKMGIRASGLSELVFEDVKLTDEHRLGDFNKGFKVAMTTLDAGRIGIAAQALGIAKGCIAESVKYSKERAQFGKTISNFQGIQFMLADMHARYDSARLVTLKAAFLKDSGKNYSLYSSKAKILAAETATFASNKAVQIHGGYGYIKEYDVERFFRDARITEIYEGTTEIQKLVVSSTLIGR